MIEVCDMWHAGVAPADSVDPVHSDIPTIILNGEYDPVTPPSLGKIAASTLSNSFFFELRGESHGVYFYNDCAMQLIGDFLDDPSISPPSECVDKLIPLGFVTDKLLFKLLTGIG